MRQAGRPSDRSGNIRVRQTVVCLARISENQRIERVKYKASPSSVPNAYASMWFKPAGGRTVTTTKRTAISPQAPATRDEIQTRGSVSNPAAIQKWLRLFDSPRSRAEIEMASSLRTGNATSNRVPRSGSAPTGPISLCSVQRIVVDTELVDEICLENERDLSHLK
jgi:hypothetical protein